MKLLGIIRLGQNNKIDIRNTLKVSNIGLVKDIQLYTHVQKMDGKSIVGLAYRYQLSDHRNRGQSAINLKDQERTPGET